MSNLEQNFIHASQHLYQVSQRFAQLKLELISAYMAEHHPSVQFHVKTMDDNILSTDVVFPCLTTYRSRQIARAINLYLQGLLERENGVNNEPL